MPTELKKVFVAIKGRWLGFSCDAFEFVYFDDEINDRLQCVHLMFLFFHALVFVDLNFSTAVGLFF